MRVLLWFRNGFPGLREGFEHLGHLVTEDPADGGINLAVADFVDCARHIGETLALRRRLRARGAPFLALSRDAPWHRGVNARRLLALALLRPFDGYAAHSLQGAARFARRTLYCPNAARESAYSCTSAELATMRDPSRFEWDVSFVGNLDTKRYPEHARRAAFLDELRRRLEGEGVRCFFGGGAGLADARLAALIRTSRINLSVLAACDAGGEPSWGLPERCYGVPACGGFLLSDRRRHAADDFGPGEWAEFRDLEDCVVRVRHFLAHPEEARAIAERAHARVVREHFYRHRAARLIDFAAHAD